jgi:hypothetical protein
MKPFLLKVKFDLKGRVFYREKFQKPFLIDIFDGAKPRFLNRGKKRRFLRRAQDNEFIEGQYQP